jgi:hypothetical protein
LLRLTVSLRCLLKGHTQACLSFSADTLDVSHSCDLVYVGCSCHLAALHELLVAPRHRHVTPGMRRQHPTCACDLYRARLRGLRGSEDGAASHSMVERGGAGCGGLSLHSPSMTTSLRGAASLPLIGGSTMLSVVPLGTCRATSASTHDGPEYLWSVLRNGRNMSVGSP